MRVFAFGDAHIATPETQRELFGREFDYKECCRFAEIVARETPDVVICLGDLCEDFWDGPMLWRKIVPELGDIPMLRLRGNHEMQGLPTCVEIDGVQYCHGLAVPNTIEGVRQRYAGQVVVHGHTHEPREPWPLDVGSITFTGTFAEIVDGRGRLRWLC